MCLVISLWLSFAFHWLARSSILSYTCLSSVFLLWKSVYSNLMPVSFFFFFELSGVANSRIRPSDLTFTFHALEQEIATHSNVLAWRIPGTWEPGWLPSMGLHRVGHDWSDLTAAAVMSCLYIFLILSAYG